MKTFALFALVIVGNLFAEPLIFKDKGNQLSSLDQKALSKLVSPQKVALYEPHLKKEVTYRGYDFNALLDKVYGEKWKQREEVLLTCADGFQPSIPRSQFEKQKAYLVFERIGGKFGFYNRAQREHVELGPYYLVWAQKTDTIEVWPYQVVGLDLISFTERFPKMSPPAGASEAAIRGFGIFRVQCLPCHTINGHGGTKGFELNYPVSVTEYFQPTWLRKWIMDPASIRYSSNMPAFDQTQPEWEKKLDDIIAYLTAMAKNPQKPN